MEKLKAVNIDDSQRTGQEHWELEMLGALGVFRLPRVAQATQRIAG
jgi:hypothetical protein